MDYWQLFKMNQFDAFNVYNSRITVVFAPALPTFLRWLQPGAYSGSVLALLLVCTSPRNWHSVSTVTA